MTTRQDDYFAWVAGLAPRHRPSRGELHLLRLRVGREPPHITVVTPRPNIRLK